MRTITKYKTIILQIIGSISGVLFVISLGIHIATFWNINLQEKFPYIFLLHIGIFILLPAIVILEKLEEKQENEKLISIFDSDQELPVQNPKSKNKLNIPKWLITCYLILGVYVVLNFIIFISTVRGTPEIRDGKYVLNDHGQIFREISKAEYDDALAHILRGFSGHWLIFYFYITAISFVGNSKDKKQNSAN